MGSFKHVEHLCSTLVEAVHESSETRVCEALNAVDRTVLPVFGTELVLRADASFWDQLLSDNCSFGATVVVFLTGSDAGVSVRKALWCDVSLCTRIAQKVPDVPPTKAPVLETKGTSGDSSTWCAALAGLLTGAPAAVVETVVAHGGAALLHNLVSHVHATVNLLDPILEDELQPAPMLLRSVETSIHCATRAMDVLCALVKSAEGRRIALSLKLWEQLQADLLCLGKHLEFKFFFNFTFDLLGLMLTYGCTLYALRHPQLTESDELVQFCTLIVDFKPRYEDSSPKSGIVGSWSYKGEQYSVVDHCGRLTVRKGSKMAALFEVAAARFEWVDPENALDFATSFEYIQAEDIVLQQKVIKPGLAGAWRLNSEVRFTIKQVGQRFVLKSPGMNSEGQDIVLEDVGDGLLEPDLTASGPNGEHVVMQYKYIPEEDVVELHVTIDDRCLTRRVPRARSDTGGSFKARRIPDQYMVINTECKDKLDRLKINAGECLSAIWLSQKGQLPPFRDIAQDTSVLGRRSASSCKLERRRSSETKHSQSTREWGAEVEPPGVADESQGPPARTNEGGEDFTAEPSEEVGIGNSNVNYCATIEKTDDTLCQAIEKCSADAPEQLPQLQELPRNNSDRCRVICGQNDDEVCINSQKSPQENDHTSEVPPAIQNKDVTERWCSNCGNVENKKEHPAFKKCSGCGVLYYCDFRCQKQHWPSHRVHCVTSRSG